jgi:hypothetical protein
VTIKPLLDCPIDYQLSDAGDSGAVWVEISTRAPVAMHVAAQSGGGAMAFAIPLPTVLKELELL